MRVRVTEVAASDLEDIKSFAADVDGAIGERILDGIRGVIQLISRWPHIGHHGARPGTLEMVIPRLPFVIVFRIDDDELIVLRVYHVRRARIET